jgi:hypothetical protein
MYIFAWFNDDTMAGMPTALFFALPNFMPVNFSGVNDCGGRLFFIF